MNKSMLETWIDESVEHKKLFAQEGLILDVTEAIWEAMERLGWTKARLAEALGKSKADVTQLLNGNRNMTLRTLADSASALGLQVRVCLCGDEKAAEWKDTDTSTLTLSPPHTAVVGIVPITKQPQRRWQSRQKQPAADKSE